MNKYEVYKRYYICSELYVWRCNEEKFDRDYTVQIECNKSNAIKSDRLRVLAAFLPIGIQDKIKTNSGNCVKLVQNEWANKFSFDTKLPMT